jgi:hypothetical protein
MNPNNRSSYNREEQTRIQTDPVRTTPTNQTYNHETVNNPNVDPNQKAAYHDGYVHGRVVENSRQERHLHDRDNNNAARGLLLGILLTSLLGLLAGALYFWNERNEAADPVDPVAPAGQVVEPSVSPSPIERETTIIERVVPIPTPQQTTPPDVNITVPESQNQAPAQSSPTDIAPTTQPNPSITDPNTQLQDVPATSPTPLTPEAGVSGETDTGVTPDDEPVNTAPDNTETNTNSASPTVPSADLSGGSNP